MEEVVRGVEEEDLTTDPMIGINNTDGHGYGIYEEARNPMIGTDKESRRGSIFGRLFPLTLNPSPLGRGKSQEAVRGKFDNLSSCGGLTAYVPARSEPMIGSVVALPH